jgi:hypothetical protein
MNTPNLNPFRNRVSALVTLLLVLMAGALGQSARQLNSTTQQAACGGKCTTVCATTACVCVKISTNSGVCVAR